MGLLSRVANYCVSHSTPLGLSFHFSIRQHGPQTALDRHLGICHFSGFLRLSK